jgi:AAA family ATP:ADP antiporter
MPTSSSAQERAEMPAISLKVRSFILFSNFFLIILAYYQVKSASRSLLIEYWGAENFPWVWIASALVLGSFIGVYHRMVERYSRLAVVLGSCLLFITLLVFFRTALAWQGAAASIAFYIFVDIFSVILVEQFWSLADSVTEAGAGRRSFWFIGTGGLLGGVIGGAAATALLEFTPMKTADLLLSCAAILVVTVALNLAMGRMGLYREVPVTGRPVILAGGWRALVKSRYLILIAASLLCSQLVQPVVEYQFIKAVETSYTALDARTEYISGFFSVLGLVSIAINLLITPLLHRYLGVMWGMVTQPVVLAAASLVFLAQPTLMIASAMKICDRGLSYSISRASKEQLYIPVDPVRTYQAKAWIDMLGYRLFKVLGSALILLLARLLPLGDNAANLSGLTLLICGAWIVVLALLAKEYHAFVNQPVPLAAG